MLKDDFSECGNDVQLDGKVAIVTGATSGTGLEVAKNLAKCGAKVIIASRNCAKVENAKNEIFQFSGRSDVVTRQMDFGSLSSVRNFVDMTVQSEPRLDILINNIGAIGLEDRLTQDNLHTMMQVNYYGMFLLTYLLFPLLKSSAPSRVVNVSSLGLILGNVDFDSWNEVGRYSSFGYYCNAKLANVLFTVEMDRRIRGSGVSVYSMDPGMGKSELFRNVDNELVKRLLTAALQTFGRPLNRVATMPVFLAVDPRVEGRSGMHLRDCKEFYSSWYANDKVLAQRLWEDSKRLLNGKVAIVTGATSGTGLEVAKNLAKRGAKIIIASRNPDKLENAKNEIFQFSGRNDVVTRQMDFGSLSSVRNFVDMTVQTEPRLDILINNIGAIGLEDRLTQDNLHTMMQVNYYGMFLLTYLLFPLLKSSSPSRVVNVSSLGLILGNADFDSWNEVGRYSNFGYYCNAKLADVLFTVEMDRRIRGSGVSVYSMDPGLGKSEFFRNYDNELVKRILNAALQKFGRPLNRVATMPVFLAVDPSVEGRSGMHFRDCKEFYSSWYANDTVLAQRLWEDSKRLVKITRDEDWEKFKQ
ncbi:Uncharacterized protein OBRU01_02266, partial [Operophtera brumata]